MLIVGGDTLEIKKLEENVRPGLRDVVRIKEMGNIIELMYQEKRNKTNVIKKLNANQYVDIRTGEVKEFKHIENRAQAINDVRKSLGRLRDYINTNVTDISKCKWVTLTYKENMTDTEKLYKDFRDFNKRMKYYLSKQGYKYEYIVAMEPQGRGAWHCHLLMIFDKKAPYIKNDSEDPKEITMSSLWGNGYTKTKKLDGNVDNLGAYLTAYLADMELQESADAGLIQYAVDGKYSISEVELEEDGKKVTKGFIKGLRMVMYPPKFNIYRCSRGIKKPMITYDSEIRAQKKISAATLTFERTINLVDNDSDYSNTINYRYYNKIRK